MLNTNKFSFEVNVVLVETLYDTNIGACSRAMANMGVENLVLINRQCEITYAAQQAAASGQYAFQNRKEYSNWDEFYKEEFVKLKLGIRVAFSARDGHGRALKDFSQTLRWLAKEHPTFQEVKSKKIPIYLIFGREDHGLSASDIELAHFNVKIPTYGNNTSLNLAQAVLLALFILRTECGDEFTENCSKNEMDGDRQGLPRKNLIVSNNRNFGDVENIENKENKLEIFPEKTLRTWLEQMGFDLTKPVNAFTVLKRMVLHNAPTEKELNMLETALQQSIRKQDKNTISNKNKI